MSPVTAEAQNTCIMIGPDGHNIARTVFSVSIVYSPTKKVNFQVRKNLFIKMKSVTIY